MNMFPVSTFTRKRAAPLKNKSSEKAGNFPSGRHSYHHGHLKKTLIDKALAQIATGGAHSLSLREVARSAGVSHTASYRHFRSKEDLLAAIAEQGFILLSNALAAAMAEKQSPLAALEASGVAYVEFGVRYPEHLQVMFSGIFADDGRWPALKQAGDRAYSLLNTAVHEALRAKQIRGDEDAISLAAWSMVHGLTQLIIGGKLKQGRQSARQLATAVISLLTKGLQTVPTKKPPNL